MEIRWEDPPNSGSGKYHVELLSQTFIGLLKANPDRWALIKEEKYVAAANFTSRCRKKYPELVFRCIRSKPGFGKVYVRYVDEVS